MSDTANLSVISGTMENTDGDLDNLVSQASRPTLAQLFEQGKATGVIKPGKEYGSTPA